MTDIFIEILTETLNTHVPEKKIKIFRHHVKVRSNETLKMMQLRNKARRNNSKEEYKKLRNECNRRVRKEKFEEAGKLIEEDPNNIWKLFNKTSKGQEDTGIKLKEGDEIIEDEKEVANIFNHFLRRS